MRAMSAPNTTLPTAAGPSRWLRPAYYAASASLISQTVCSMRVERSIT